MSCPTEVGTELGFIGASRFSEPGGASNYLCMPKDPEYKSDLNYRSSKDGYSVVYGVEYEYPVHGTHDDNAPCALCFTSNRSSLITIPAKYSCPPGWTREYYGYLMSSWKDLKRTMFVCVWTMSLMWCRTQR